MFALRNLPSRSVKVEERLPKNIKSPFSDELAFQSNRLIGLNLSNDTEIYFFLRMPI